MKRQKSDVVFTFGVPLEGTPLRSIVREGLAAETMAHCHPCGQLLYPEQGATILEVNNALVRLGPDRAAWIPPDVPHAVLIERPYRYHSVYIEPDFCPSIAFAVILITPLLRALVLDAQGWPRRGEMAVQDRRKACVLVDEIERAPALHPQIHHPRDERIAQICRALERDPSDRTPLATWAKHVGASEKTLQRAFTEHTGLTFQQWRNFMRMTFALELHREGRRVIDVAVELGFATEGAYAQSFKKFYGYPPSKISKVPIQERL